MSKRSKSLNYRGIQEPPRYFGPPGLDLRVLCGIAIIAACVFLAYLPAINGEFVLDDDYLLTKNIFIKASDGPYRLWCTSESIDYWPMTNTSFWIEWRLWVINPTGYHITNLILHILAVLLIWVVLRKLSIPGAFLAAMVFALHPVNVESVAWIAQRKNMMSMLFFLLSIFWYLQADMSTASAGMEPARSHGGPWERGTSHAFSSFIFHPSSFHFWYWLSLAAFMLAMLSKGSAAVLPVLLLGILWWLRSLTSRDLLRIAPFFLLAFVLTGVNIWFQTHGKYTEIRNAGFTERLIGAGAVPWFYLYKALLPFDLAFIYPPWHIEVSNPLWWLPLLAALAVTGLLWWFRKGWSRPLLFAWGFICVSLLPVMGFTDVGFMKYSLVADHYQHIAIIGVIALAAAGWSIWLKRARIKSHRVTTAVAIVAVGLFTFLTWQQSMLYRDKMTLYQDTLEKNPGCWIIHNNLGQSLADAGQPLEAIKHYEQALRQSTNDFETINNLGNALIRIGRLQEAIKYCDEALRLNPDCPEIHYNLGNALAQAGRPQEAIEHYQKALSLKPDYHEVLNNLGITLLKTSRPQEAIERFKQALVLKPDFVDAHLNIGVALANTGRPQEAVDHFEKAIKLRPNYAEIHNHWAATLFKMGRTQEAIDHYNQALSLKPDMVEAQFNLAVAYAKMRQSSQAIAAAQRALDLARSQGQTALAEQIENLLNNYRANLPN
jgi:protein O-mannosyl-transferase